MSAMMQAPTQAEIDQAVLTLKCAAAYVTIVHSGANERAWIVPESIYNERRSVLVVMVPLGEPK